MKKVLSIILAVMLIVCALPISAFAAGSVSVSTSSISMAPGQSKTFTITATNAAGRVDISSSNTAVATVSTASEWLDNSTVTVTVKAVAAGSATISVVCTDVSDYDLNTISGTKTISINVAEATTAAPTTTKPKTTASTAANLKSLTVDGFELNEKFSGGRTSYSITVPKDTKSIDVSALPLNSNCKVTGTGTLNITELPQTFRIICKAPNGETKTYTLTVKAAADPLVVNLTDLIVSTLCELTPEFDPTVYEYTAIVPAGTKAVNVDAIFDEVANEGATVKVEGADDLAASNNTVTVTVTAKDGTETVYTINIEFAEAEKTEAPAQDDSSDGISIWIIIFLVILLIVFTIAAYFYGKKKGEEAYGYDDDDDDDDFPGEIERDTSFIQSIDE